MKINEINPADVLAQKEAGESLRSIAKQYGISTSTVSRLVSKALDAKMDEALGEQPADGDESVFAFGITGATQSEIKESYNKAVAKAKGENAGKVPVHVSKAIKAANEAALAAIAPPSTKRSGSKSSTPREERHPRHQASLDVKKRCGYHVPPAMLKTRKKLPRAELVALIRQSLKENPGTSEYVELEYAYWVLNISTSKSGFAKAWAEATAA